MAKRILSVHRRSVGPCQPTTARRTKSSKTSRQRAYSPAALHARASRSFGHAHRTSRSWQEVKEWFDRQHGTRLRSVTVGDNGAVEVHARRLCRPSFAASRTGTVDAGGTRDTRHRNQVWRCNIAGATTASSPPEEELMPDIELPSSQRATPLVEPDETARPLADAPQLKEPST